MKSPYETLGVASTASAGDIQKAYRKLAKALHPDLNPGDKGAEETFKEASAAYALLGDPEKRRRFDAGEIDASGAERSQQRYYRDYAAQEDARPYESEAGYADFMEGDDALAALLRRARQARANRRGEDVRYRLAVPFVESIAGAEKRLTMPDGGVLDVKIPPGLVDGQTLRLKGKGAPGAGAGAPGDALIEVEVLPDPRFRREGDDIHVEVPVSLSEAVLGGWIDAPTPTGPVSVAIPKGSNSGSRLRLKGKGAPIRGGGAGDEYVTLKVVLPKPADPELVAFVEGWARGKAYNPRTGAAS